MVQNEHTPVLCRAFAPKRGNDSRSNPDGGESQYLPDDENARGRNGG
ncbi:MAG: hypothetical protein KGN84_09665 [Acidobacteriota bacterium]|nr:hypothetical protein [Acidobacteriota bacterium]